MTTLLDLDTSGSQAAQSASAVKTLKKALALLEWVARAENPPTTGELAMLSCLSRPTTHRLVQTLIGAGFLQQHSDGRLAIGLGVLPLAASVLDTNRLRTGALPHLQVLAQKANARVNLGILYQQRVMILGGVEKPSLPGIHSRFGLTAPMHCSALGKAMLAHLPADQVQAILRDQPLIARTPNTITSLPALLAELDKTRERGWSTEFRESSATSCCIGVAILDGAAAISMSGRSLELLEKEIGPMLETAELISHMLR
ncbi:MAG TPA: IclR family transcriptional regulator [Solimonas sp.]|nr:IclR family transcriptional regulator [Solimonas sp.]